MYKVTLHTTRLYQSYSLMLTLCITLLLCSALLIGCGSSEQITLNTTEPIRAASTVLPSPSILTPLVSSSNSNQLTPTPSAVIQNWEDLWLTGIPCRSPCWLGIVPGNTTLNEAIKILKQNTLVDERSVEFGASNSEVPVLKWRWQSGVFVNRITSQSNNLVNSISAVYSKKFKLGDIVKVYGEPTYITVNNIGGIPSVSLLWLSKGFLIGMNGVQHQPPPDIDINLLLGGPIGGPIFFPTSTNVNDIKTWSTLNPTKLLRWQGYKAFNFYMAATTDLD